MLDVVVDCSPNNLGELKRIRRQVRAHVRVCVCVSKCVRVVVLLFFLSVQRLHMCVYVCVCVFDHLLSAWLIQGVCVLYGEMNQTAADTQLQTHYCLSMLVT